MANDNITDWEDVSDSINDWEDVTDSTANKSPVNDYLSMQKAGFRSAAEGVTFGFADEIWGSVRGIVDDIS